MFFDINFVYILLIALSCDAIQTIIENNSMGGTNNNELIHLTLATSGTLLIQGNTNNVVLREAYIFRDSGDNTWALDSTITDPHHNVDGAFGDQVEVIGDDDVGYRIFITDPYYDPIGGKNRQGLVHVYNELSSVPQVSIAPADIEDCLTFGGRVAAFDTTLLISSAFLGRDNSAGAICTDPVIEIIHHQVGYVYVFRESVYGLADYTEAAKLSPANHNAFDSFGTDIVMSSTMFAASAPLFDAGNSNTGNIVIFVDTASNGVYEEHVTLSGSDNLSSNTQLGARYRLSMHDTVIVAGSALAEDAFCCIGAIYIYEESSLDAWDWTEIVSIKLSRTATPFTVGMYSFVEISSDRIIAIGNPFIQSTHEGNVFMLTESTPHAQDWHYSGIITYLPNEQIGDLVFDNTGQYLFTNGDGGSIIYVNEKCPTVNRFIPCDCTNTGNLGEYCDEPCPMGLPTFRATSTNAFDYDVYTQCDCTGLGTRGSICDVPCLNGGLSYPDSDFKNCNCSGLPYVGSVCDKDCYNGFAQATDSYNMECNCTLSGATGKFCTTDVDDCLSSPCANGGTCTDYGADLFPNHNNEFNCSCGSDSPYMGPTCEDTLCYSSPCLHGGSCINGEDLACNCTGGYEGEFCQTEIDECASSPCLNDGICTDLLGDFTCDCTGSGYEGFTCSMDVDDCLSSPCDNDGACQDKGANKFKCTCDEFWEGSVCNDDVDDCILKGYYCENGAECADDPVNMGDVICSCAVETDGFTGKYCNVPIEDACVTFNPCANGGKCLLDDITKAMSCDCTDTGYEGDICDVQVYVSECVSSPCLNEGQCYDPSDYQDDWYCICANDYFGDICDLQACDSNPCQNGGTCTNDDDAYTCACLENFSGFQCDVNDDEQVGIRSSSSSSSRSPGGEDSNNDDDTAKNAGGGVLIIIVIAVLVAVAVAAGGFYFFKKRQSTKSTFAMPT